jgi:hypothetical protein
MIVDRYLAQDGSVAYFVTVTVGCDGMRGV